MDIQEYFKKNNLNINSIGNKELEIIKMCIEIIFKENIENLLKKSILNMNMDDISSIELNIDDDEWEEIRQKVEEKYEYLKEYKLLHLLISINSGYKKFYNIEKKKSIITKDFIITQTFINDITIINKKQNLICMEDIKQIINQNFDVEIYNKNTNIETEDKKIHFESFFEAEIFLKDLKYFKKIKIDWYELDKKEPNIDKIEKFKKIIPEIIDRSSIKEDYLDTKIKKWNKWQLQSILFLKNTSLNEYIINKLKEANLEETEEKIIKKLIESLKEIDKNKPDEIIKEETLTIYKYKHRVIIYIKNRGKNNDDDSKKIIKRIEKKHKKMTLYYNEKKLITIDVLKDINIEKTVNDKIFMITKIIIN